MLFINAVVFSGSRGPIALLRESKTLVLNDLELLLALFSFFLLFFKQILYQFQDFFQVQNRAISAERSNSFHRFSTNLIYAVDKPCIRKNFYR